MRTVDFLVLLRSRDIQVWLEGDRLRCNAPAGALTPELRRDLQQRKGEILAFLRSAGTLAQQPRAIVPLQPHGTRTPVFAVGGHNGDVFCFRALAHHLGRGQPFFGLQPPGLDGRDAPMTRVEDLAAYFVSQIRALRPEGAYVVAGYCAGGTIAFEVARQLVRDGATVQGVALFGSSFPTAYRLLPQGRQYLEQLVERAARQVRAMISRPLLEQRAHVAGWLRSLHTERAAERQAALDPVLAWRDIVGRATLAAIRRYAPGSFSGRLSLFWPCRTMESGALLQWPLVARDTRIFYGPQGCDGANMLLEPFAARFAELFKSSASDNRTVAPRQSTAAAAHWQTAH